MNWINVAIGAAAGALAGVAGTLIGLAWKPKKTWASAAIVVVLFSVFNQLGQQYVFPKVDLWYAASHAEGYLLQVPVYPMLKQYDREAYDNMLADLKQGLKRGEDVSQTMGRMRSRLMPIIAKRLPTASDEAVSNYVGVIVTELKDLRVHGGDLCFHSLFPNGPDTQDSRQYHSKETQNADVAALAEVIRTSAQRPSPVPTEADASSSLQPVYEALANEFGEGVSMLATPQAPTTDKGKVCEMSIFLYSRILQLPPAKRGMALRYMFSQS